jgi:hypothetical protein
MIESKSTARESDEDEALDDAAQGYVGSADDDSDDDTADDSGEIDAIGHAAGLVNREDKPFRGIEEVDRRDEHRWELDPKSADSEPTAT